jgi:hypothetical protein
LASPSRIITVPGYLVTKAITLFPLSTRFLDEDYLADENQHVHWGLLAWTVIGTLIGIGLALVF